MFLHIGYSKNYLIDDWNDNWDNFKSFFHLSKIFVSVLLIIIIELLMKHWLKIIKYRAASIYPIEYITLINEPEQTSLNNVEYLLSKNYIELRIINKLISF